MLFVYGSGKRLQSGQFEGNIKVLVLFVFFQVPLMGRRGCTLCGLMTFDDLASLESLFSSPVNEIMCPLCDSDFTDCDSVHN